MPGSTISTPMVVIRETHRIASAMDSDPVGGLERPEGGGLI
jgi:hypothetical protein